jgi:hypothetical protein
MGSQILPKLGTVPVANTSSVERVPAFVSALAAASSHDFLLLRQPSIAPPIRFKYLTG